MFLQNAGDAALMQDGIMDLSGIEFDSIALTEYDSQIDSAGNRFPSAIPSVVWQYPTRLPVSEVWPGSGWSQGLLTNASTGNYRFSYGAWYPYNFGFGYSYDSWYSYGPWYGLRYSYSFDFGYPYDSWYSDGFRYSYYSFWDSYGSGNAPVVEEHHYVHEPVVSGVAGESPLAIPEPATLALLGLGAPIFLRRRKKRLTGTCHWHAIECRLSG